MVEKDTYFRLYIYAHMVGGVMYYADGQRIYQRAQDISYFYSCRCSSGYDYSMVFNQKTLNYQNRFAICLVNRFFLLKKQI